MVGKLAAHGILTRKDLIAELGVNDDILLRWEKDHDFPARSVGRTTFYDVEQIKKWIAAKPQSKR